MTYIDRDMQVGEALYILGHPNPGDVDALMREIFKKADEFKEIKAQSRVHGQHRLLYQSQRDEARDKLEALRTYIKELEDTGNFIDKQKIMNILGAEE